MVVAGGCVGFGVVVGRNCCSSRKSRGFGSSSSCFWHLPPGCCNSIDCRNSIVDNVDCCGCCCCLVFDDGPFEPVVVVVDVANFF